MTELEDLTGEAITWAELEARRTSAQRHQLRRRTGILLAEGVVVAVGSWLWSRARRPVATAA